MERMFDPSILPDPEVFAECTLPARSDLVAYENEAESRDFLSLSPAPEGYTPVERSSFRISLNGIWKFAYARNLAEAPEGFEHPETDCHGWADIRVPGHLEMQCYGVPGYVNTQYPWDGHEDLAPGQIPEEFNPVGSYVKYFTLPEGFLKDGLFLSLEGAESGAAVYLNGHYAGYSEDSFTTHEFDLTPFVKEGENKLAIRTFRFTSGSWCEDQDFFRFTGIFRSVSLYTRPAVHLLDADVRTRRCRAGEEALLEVRAVLTRPGRVTLTLFEEKMNPATMGMEVGGRVLEGALESGFSGTICRPAAGGLREGLAQDAPEELREDFIQDAAGGLREGLAQDAPGAQTGESSPSGQKRGIFTKEDRPLYDPEQYPDCAAGTFSIKNPRLWSAEKPELYLLQLDVYDENGVHMETVPLEVGFREFKLGPDHIMYLNGKRIVFNGADRHEFSSRRGRALTEQDMLTDILNMKRNNINAIRMSHYPNQRRMYQLCDRFGLYVIDETNLETHGTWDPVLRGVCDASYALPKDHPEWLGLVLERARNMYERDKNHACVLIWSCGNESFGGRDIYEMSEYFRRVDDTRPVHYEGVFHDRSYNGTSDIESRMYPSVAEVRDFLRTHRDKPFIMCEYTHAMGNSCGAMRKYTDLALEDPLYQGGFIWDYIDQSLTMKDRFGNEFEAYGGDHGERPTDWDFSGNGIAFGGDGRKPSPKMVSVKYNYQPFRIAVDAPGRKAEVRNLSLFTDASEYSAVVTVERNGRPVSRRELLVACAPGERTEVDLSPYVCDAPGVHGGETLIRLSFHLKTDTPYAKAGHEVAFGEAVAGVPVLPEEMRGARKGLKISCGPNNWGVKGENFEVLFSGLSGGMISYRYAGKELLESPVRPNFWRPPTQNDVGNGMPQRYAQWKVASECGLYKESGFHGYNHYMMPLPPKVEKGADFFRITFSYRLWTTPAAGAALTHEVFPDGTVKTTLSYDPVPELMDMPEFGMMFKMKADFHRLLWYGLGPEETYADRTEGAKLGIHKGLAETQLAPYMVPQESGNHAGVRYARVTDDSGAGLLLASDGPMVSPYRVVGTGSGREAYEGQPELPGLPDTSFYGRPDPAAARCAPMSFSALPWTPAEIEHARHPFELPPVHYTVVRVSLGQMGISGDDTWGSLTHPEYLLDVSKKMEFSFYMKGI